MVKSAVRRRRFEEVSPLLLPPPPSIMLALGGDGAAESPPLDAAPLLSSTDPNVFFANEHEDATSTMAPSMINDARLAAPHWVDLTTTTTITTLPADETTNWEEETATAYLDETKLSEEEAAAAAAAASEAPAISDPAVEEEAAGGATSTETIDTEGTPTTTTTTTTSTAIPVEQQPLPTVTYVPNNEKTTSPPIYQGDPLDESAATPHPQPLPDARQEQLKTTAMGLVLALIFVFYMVRRCCRRRDGWDTSRGQYRAVANQYASNQYDDAFADDLSDYEEDDDEVMDDRGDDSSYNGNGKMIELKDMKKDRGRLSLQEMNG
jgi:hypothetical protein